MLPATIAARGRAVARGYGELLMLNAPGVSPLSAYRYSPYTVPSSAAAAVAAAAAAANSSSAAVSSSTPTQTLSHLTMSKGQQNSLAGMVPCTAASAMPTIQQIQHHQLVAALGSAGSPVLSLAPQQPQSQQNVTATQQAAAVQTRVAIQTQQQAVTQQSAAAAATQQQLQHLQQLQILGLDSAGRLIPATIPTTHQPVVTAPPPNLYSTAMTVANGMPTAAAALAAASCKQRTAAASVPTAVALAAGTGSMASSEVQSHITYSLNDLVNFQSLQPLEAAANYQVPVGL